MAAKIKICGITNSGDARLCAGLGADLLGFNFYCPSPRYIDPEAAGKIIAELPPETATVGVFVNAGVSEIARVLQQCPLHMAQLHGDETPADCQAVAGLGVKVVKAVRIRSRENIDQAKDFDVEAVFLDAFHAELYGGTGDRFDWSWLSGDSGRKIFLAGGIGPKNITEALSVGTYGVDLCSGVERTPGVKDAEKMQTLFERIKGYYG